MTPRQRLAVKRLRKRRERARKCARWDYDHVILGPGHWIRVDRNQREVSGSVLVVETWELRAVTS